MRWIIPMKTKSIFKKLFWKIGASLVCFIFIIIVMMVFFHSSPSPSPLVTKSYSILSEDKNSQRVCTGQGLQVSCKSLYLENYQSKTNIINEAKYLYIKAYPSLINIKKIKVEYVPDDVRQKYFLTEIMIKKNDEVSEILEVRNNVTNQIIPLNNQHSYQGFTSFSFDLPFLEKPLQSISIKELKKGRLNVKYMNINNEVVAVNEKVLTNNEKITLNTKEATFTKNIGYGKILSNNFKTLGITARITRAMLNGRVIEPESNSYSMTTDQSMSIELKQFGEWIIEIEAVQGNFQNVILENAGLKEFEVAISTFAIDDISKIFNINGVTKKAISEWISFDLNTDYFLMNSLFRNDIHFNYDLNELLFNIWKELNENLMFDEPIIAKYKFNNANDLLNDVLAIPYLDVEMLIKDKQTTAKSEINTLTLFEQNSPTLNNLVLNGLWLGNQNVMNFPNIRSLSLLNAGITNSSFLTNNSTMPLLTSLNLSENNFSGDAFIFKNLNNYSLTNLNLMNTNISGNALLSFLANVPEDSNLSASLTSLDLSKNKYLAIPDFGMNFSQLRILNFSENNISSIQALENMRMPLEKLNLNMNKIISSQFLQLSNNLKNSLLSLDIANNKNLEPIFISNQASFLNLEKLNIENTMITSNVLNSFSILNAPALSELNISNVNLSDVSLTPLQVFLNDKDSFKLKIKNIEISDSQLRNLLNQDIVKKLVYLDLSGNSKITGLPHSGSLYEKITTLNISGTSIYKLPEGMHLKTLIATNLEKFLLEEILNLNPNLDYNFSGSSLLLSDNAFHLFQLHLANVKIILTGVTVYHLMGANIIPFQTLVDSLLKKLLDEVNLDRKQFTELEFKSEITNVQKMNLVEPLYYHQILFREKAFNRINNKKIVINKIAKETDYFIKNDQYSKEDMKEITKTFKISFENYGLFWSKSYLAAVVLAPIMIVIFSLVNLLFVYHYKIKERKKESEDKYEEKK